MKFEYIIYIAIFCDACLSKQVGDKKKQSESDTFGPFHAILVRTEACTSYKPSRPYDRNPYYMYYGELYNTTNKINLLRGNITVLKPYKIRDMLHIKGYQWRDGKWQIKYNFNNIACDGIIRTYMAALLGYKKSCNLSESVYPFEGIDYDQIEHLIRSSGREYGRVLWVFEVFVKRRGTQFCWESEALVVPAKHT